MKRVLRSSVIPIFALITCFGLGGAAKTSSCVADPTSSKNTTTWSNNTGHSSEHAVWKSLLSSELLDKKWRERLDSLARADDDEDLLGDYFGDALGSAYSRWRSQRTDRCVVLTVASKVSAFQKAYDDQEEAVLEAAYVRDDAVVPRERCVMEETDIRALGEEYRDALTSCKWQSEEGLDGIAYPTSPHQVRMIMRAVRVSRTFKGVSVIAGGHGAECATAVQGALLISLEKLKFIQLTSTNEYMGGNSVFANDRYKGASLMGLGYENWQRFACVHSVDQANKTMGKIEDLLDDHVWDPHDHMDHLDDIDSIKEDMSVASKGLCGRSRLRTGWSPRLYRDTNAVVLGGGVEWGEAYFEMVARGYLLHGGSCYSVGVSGYTIGGGLGLLTRSMGYGVDQVEAIEYVDARGAAKILTVDVVKRATRDGGDAIRDMWWGLLGGGRTALGLVTKWVLQATPRSKAGCTYLVDLKNLFVNDRDKMVEAAKAYACWVNNVDEELGEEHRNKFTFRFALHTRNCSYNAPDKSKTPWEYPAMVRYQMMWNDMSVLREEDVPEDRDPKKVLKKSVFFDKGAALLGKCRVPIPGREDNDAAAWREFMLEKTDVNCVGKDWEPGTDVTIDQLTANADRKLRTGKATGFLGNYALTAWISQPWKPEDRGNTMHSMYLYTFSDRFAEELVYSFVGPQAKLNDNIDFTLLPKDRYPRTFHDLYDPSVYGCLSGTEANKENFMKDHYRYIDTTHVGGKGEHVDPDRPSVSFDVFRKAKNVIFFDYNYPLSHDDAFKAVSSEDVVKTVLSNQNALKVLSDIHRDDVVRNNQKITDTSDVAPTESALRSYVLLDDSRFAVCQGCGGRREPIFRNNYSVIPDWSKWTVTSCPSFVRYYGEEAAQRLRRIKKRVDPNGFLAIKRHDILRMIDKPPWVKGATPLEKICAAQHSWLNQPDMVQEQWTD